MKCRYILKPSIVINDASDSEIGLCKHPDNSRIVVAKYGEVGVFLPFVGLNCTPNRCSLFERSTEVEDA